MRKAALVSLIVLSVVVAAIIYGHSIIGSHRLQLKTYFQNAQGLQDGALVQIAGVNVGSVAQVRVRPELAANPAEVTLDISTHYDLSIPNDSTACLGKVGLFGETILVIEIHGTSGPPVTSGAVLKSCRTAPPETQTSPGGGSNPGEAPPQK